MSCPVGTKKPKMVGNKYALGHKGTEKKYKTPAELKKKIDEYFESLFEHRILKDKEGNVIKDDDDNILKERVRIAHPTVAGLALALNMDYVSLRNYEKTEGYEEYFKIVKEAKLKIQEYVESLLYDRNSATGAIFNLKANFNHVEKTVVENVHSGTVSHEHKANLENYEKRKLLAEKYEEQLFNILKKDNVVEGEVVEEKNES